MVRTDDFSQFASYVFCAFVVLTNIDTLSPFLTVEDVAQPDDEDEDSDDDGELLRT